MDKFRSETGSSSFAESRYAKISNWLDTGFYALNRILSGNTRKGIAFGRITLFAGDSQSGKSMIAAKCVIDALKNHDFAKVFILDSEGGSLYSMLEESGVNMEDIEQVLVDSSEDCKSKMVQILEFIKSQQEKYKEYDLHFLIILDSIGALASIKSAKDAQNGSTAVDMGSNARVIGEMITLATIPALKTDTPIIMLNHTYDSPGQLTPSKLKSMKGGRKVLYMPRFSIQCTAVQRKADKMYGKSDDDTFWQGNEFTFFCFKNAAIRPFFEAKAQNNFVDPQITKYYGLFDVAEGYGLIVRNNSQYTIPEYSGDKKWWAKDIICGKESDAIWEKLMPLIDAKSEVDMAFGSMVDAPGFSSDGAKAMEEEMNEFSESSGIDDMNPNVD